MVKLTVFGPLLRTNTVDIDAFDVFQTVKIVFPSQHINLLNLNTGNSLSATFERNHCDGSRALFTLIYINMRGSRIYYLDMFTICSEYRLGKDLGTSKVMLNREAES
jgi:hypothetical protein